MSTLKNRVVRLEEKNGRGFCVVLPTELDGEGHEFEERPNERDVCAVRYSDGTSALTIDRQRSETLSELESRAAALVREEFNTPVVLPFYVKWI